MAGDLQCVTSGLHSVVACDFYCVTSGVQWTTGGSPTMISDFQCVTSGQVLIPVFFRKEYGLNTFLPSILLENVKLKEIRKHLRYYLKRDVSQPASVTGTPNHHSPLRKNSENSKLFIGLINDNY